MEIKKCDPDSLINAEFMITELENPHLSARLQERYKDFTKQNACLNFSGEKPASITLTFVIKYKREEISMPRLVYNAISVATLFILLPTHRNVTDRVELDVLDRTTGKSRKYFAEADYSELLSILVVPAIPFREYRSRAEVLERLMLDNIRQARKDINNL